MLKTHTNTVYSYTGVSCLTPSGTRGGGGTSSTGGGGGYQGGTSSTRGVLAVPGAGGGVPY